MLAAYYTTGITCWYRRCSCDRAVLFLIHKPSGYDWTVNLVHTEPFSKLVMIWCRVVDVIVEWVEITCSTVVKVPIVIY